MNRISSASSRYQRGVRFSGRFSHIVYDYICHNNYSSPSHYYRIMIRLIILVILYYYRHRHLSLLLLLLLLIIIIIIIIIITYDRVYLLCLSSSSYV